MGRRSPRFLVAEFTVKSAREVLTTVLAVEHTTLADGESLAGMGDKMPPEEYARWELQMLRADQICSMIAEVCSVEPVELMQKTSGKK